MSEHTHTPGPWKLSCAPFDMAVTAIVDGKQRDLMAARGNMNDEAEANITLAAAAPELLESLQAAIAAEGNLDDYEPEWLEPAKLIVAKATGKKQP